METPTIPQSAVDSKARSIITRIETFTPVSTDNVVASFQSKIHYNKD
ncbi:MAG: hypothetical protein PWP14_1247 [Methanolobus sp.]|nr:hypothetical protein [Methanolobus sp.]